MADSNDSNMPGSSNWYTKLDEDTKQRIQTHLGRQGAVDVTFTHPMPLHRNTDKTIPHATAVLVGMQPAPALANVAAPPSLTHIRYEKGR